MSLTTQTPRAIGYVRVSTGDQVREGVSLDVQVARIRAYRFQIPDEVEPGAAGDEAARLEHGLDLPFEGA